MVGADDLAEDQQRAQGQHNHEWMDTLIGDRASAAGSCDNGQHPSLGAPVSARPGEYACANTTHKLPTNSLKSEQYSHLRTTSRTRMNKEMFWIYNQEMLLTVTCLPTTTYIYRFVKYDSRDTDLANLWYLPMWKLWVGRNTEKMSQKSRNEIVGDGSDEVTGTSHWIVLFCERYWLAGVGGRSCGQRVASGGKDNYCEIGDCIEFLTKKWNWIGVVRFLSHDAGSRTVFRGLGFEEICEKQGISKFAGQLYLQLLVQNIETILN